MSLFNPLRFALRTRVTALNARAVQQQLPRRTISSTVPQFAAHKLPPQPRIRLGSEAPNFKATTTHGEIDFHK